ncbi:MAG TPA: glycosyltransferase family 39 protein [Candidatus Binataceae bacterium]|nr:glycosyltransferase family 39 protein [Candidatus Binataceae bacterium]
MNHDEEIVRAVVPELAAPERGAAESAAARPAIPALLATLCEPRFAIPFLLAIGALLYLVNLGGYPLYTKGEPREAVTVFDIVHGGGIILPLRAGIELPSKPLLMHWIAALFSLLAGQVTVFTVRLPSAMFAIGGMIVCYGYVRRLYDSATGLVAALIVGTTAQYLQAGTGSRVDMTLTFFLTVAFFEFIMIAEGLTRRRMLLYVAISLAILAKGPVGLVLPGLAALVWIILERRWDLLRSLKMVRGAIVVAIIGGGWYAGAIYLGGMSFIKKQLLGENLVRFVGGSNFHQGHAHPFFYIELALLIGFMPWTILLGVAALGALRNPRPMNPRLAYLLTWFITVMVFYSIATSKRGVYLLALYPALAAILAIYLTDALADPRPSLRYVTFVGWCAGGALVGAGALALASLIVLAAAPGEMRYFMAFWTVRAPGFVPALRTAASQRWFAAIVIPLGVEWLGFHLWRKPGSIARLIGTTAAASAAITLAANLIVIPAIANTLSLRGFTMQVLNTIGAERFAYLGALDYDIAFYSGLSVPIVHAHDPNLPNYLVCWTGMYRTMPESVRRNYVIALKSNPTELDGSGVIVLLRRATLAPAPGSNAVEVRFDRGARPIPAMAAGRDGAVTRRARREPPVVPRSHRPPDSRPHRSAARRDPPRTRA